MCVCVNHGGESPGYLPLHPRCVDPVSPPCLRCQGDSRAWIMSVAFGITLLVVEMLLLVSRLSRVDAKAVAARAAVHRRGGVDGTAALGNMSAAEYEFGRKVQ